MFSTSELAGLVKVLSHLATCRCAGSSRAAELLGTMLTADTQQKELISKSKTGSGKQKRGPAGLYYQADLSNGSSQWAQGATDAIAILNATLAEVPVRDGGGKVELASMRAVLSTKGHWQRNLHAMGLDQVLSIRKATEAEALHLETEFPQGLAPPATLIPTY